MRAASTLMSMFPPDGWADVARIEHVERATTELRQEVTQLRADVVVEIAGVRVEMAHMRAELKDEISGVRAGLKDEIAALRVEMHALFRRQTSWIAGFMGTLTVSMVVALLR